MLIKPVSSLISLIKASKGHSPSSIFPVKNPVELSLGYLKIRYLFSDQCFITTNIIMWISMFSKKSKRIVKIINSIVFFLMHYILILSLSIITNDKLDVFDSTKLYQNTDIHSLIEAFAKVFPFCRYHQRMDE